MYGHFDNEGKMSGDNTAYIYPGMVIYIRLVIMVHLDAYISLITVVEFQNEADEIQKIFISKRTS